MTLYVGNSSTRNIVLHCRAPVGQGHPPPLPLVPGGMVEITSANIGDLMDVVVRNGGVEAGAAPAGFAGLLYSSVPIPSSQLGPVNWPAPYPPPRQMVTTWP